MEIKKHLLQKYLHELAIEQLVDDYTSKGYTVLHSVTVGTYQPDLVVKKGTEFIYIEVKTNKMTPEKRKKIVEIGNFVRQNPNHKFLAVIATEPRDKKLEIESIMTLIEAEMNADLPDELDQLSSHSRVEEVMDVDIREISIHAETISAKGVGVVSVSLQFGSDAEQDTGRPVLTESFPFEFDLEMKYGPDQALRIAKVNDLRVDTSSYYDGQNVA
jgi:Holliday junction resolvase